MALYGHPESGAHWENHLTDALKRIGGESVEGHTSSFWFPWKGMLLTVYVDDLLLRGPVKKHQEFWSALRTIGNIKIEEPEILDRFLGSQHDRNVFMSK